MSNAASNASYRGFYDGKRVFLTGHTGFKGGWLALWLHQLGASVSGYANEPPTEPSFFRSAGVARALATDVRADLADLTRLRTAMKDAAPEVVFHLAAQPLVLASYRDPLGTFATNVMGTANLLETVRDVPTVRAVVVITTDKVYEVREGAEPYREADPLGGHDPYSASKAAAEITTASYRASFFPGHTAHPAKIATARAGNVIGGGDWASDRLIPDCVRAFMKDESVQLRFPGAVRPWQHVLEPLAGYLSLARSLAAPEGSMFARAWNFGPDPGSDATVGEVAKTTAYLWGGSARVEFAPSTKVVHETSVLRLDSGKARTELAWKPHWGLEQALTKTVAWYRTWAGGADMYEVSLDQIRAYETAGQE